MSSSDWLQIVLSLIGFFLGAVISWVFYRAQQSTDFNALRVIVNQLKERLTAYYFEYTKRSEQSDQLLKRVEEIMVDVIGATTELETLATLQDLTSIRSNIDKINDNLDKAVKDIITEMRVQQETLSKTVQEKFEDQSKEAIRVIEKSLRQELKDVVPGPYERDILLSKFLELIEQAINGMGQFQRINLEQQSASVLTTVESRVTETINEVVNEVKDLKDKVEALPTALPAPTPPSPARLT